MGQFVSPKYLLTPPQTAYFRNLQWKNRKEPSGTPTIINIDQIKNVFKNWKEITSISPSNRHLCHYKSLLVADGHYKKYENKGMSNKIWIIVVTLINAVLLTSIPLTRRKEFISIMIKKRKIKLQDKYTQNNR